MNREEERMVRWHWQNLNESGRELLHGRAWFYFGPERDEHPIRRCINPEWRVGRWNGLRAMFTRGGEERDWSASVGLGFVSLYLSADGFTSWRDRPGGWGVDYGGYYADDHFVLKWGYAEDGGGSLMEQGWSRSWFVRDVLFGRAKYTSAPEPPVAAEVVMPEGSYPCSVVMHLDTWKRPRWPWPRRIRRATVEIEGGIPVPGKGENSWDCGEDATFGQTAPASSVAEAVEGVRRSVLRRRERYGGRNWTPARPA